MKALWSAVSFLSVVHLLALVLFVGWLWRTDRLSAQRVQQLRDVFGPTIAEELAREAAAEKAQGVTSEAPDAVPARLSSREQLNVLTMLQEQEQQVSNRLKEESEMLATQFEQLAQQTEAQRAVFEAERESWEEATRAERERKADEQFAQTVQQYESVPARQARDMLIELVERGDREQAVAYLDAMNKRAASRILREFKTPEQVVLATELLEELRTFGLGTVESESARNDDATDSSEPAAP